MSRMITILATVAVVAFFTYSLLRGNETHSVARGVSTPPSQSVGLLRENVRAEFSSQGGEVADLDDRRAYEDFATSTATNADLTEVDTPSDFISASEYFGNSYESEGVVEVGDYRDPLADDFSETGTAPEAVGEFLHPEVEGS